MIGHGPFSTEFRQCAPVAERSSAEMVGAVGYAMSKGELAIEAAGSSDQTQRHAVVAERVSGMGYFMSEGPIRCAIVEEDQRISGAPLAGIAANHGLARVLDSDPVRAGERFALGTGAEEKN